VTLEQLANLGELIGGIGVVISLVYLAIQVRTNTSALRSTASWDANHTFAELNDRIWQDPEWAELLRRSTQPDVDAGTFTDAEQFRLHVFGRSNFQRLESQYFLHKSGLLAAGIWDNRLRWNSGLVNLPFWKEWWAAESTGNSIFTREFVDEINASAPETIHFLGTRRNE